MSDVRDWGAFLRGRWDWTKFGYEKDFPRGCQFTDIDAAVEFDGHRLILETKRYDGEGEIVKPPNGQLRFLRDEALLGKTVLVVYGCGVCNDPYAVYDVGRDRWFDWRGQSKVERRRRLHNHINRAMGLGVQQVAV